MKILRYVFNRTTFMIVMVGLEAQVILGLVRWFGNVAAWIGVVLQIISILVVLYIIKNSRHLSSDMMWIILILLAPIPGAALWLFLAGNLFSSRTFRSLVKTTEDSKHYYKQDPDVLEKAEQASPELRGQFRYIATDAGFPFYENTGFDYYRLGDEGYPVMLEELRTKFPLAYEMSGIAARVIEREEGLEVNTD